MRMMRKELLVVLFLFSMFQTYAQRRLDVPEFYLGASAGATGSMVMFSPMVAQDFQTGMNAGAAFRYIGDQNVGMQMELNFIQYGWQEKGTSNHNRMLNYMEVPFLTHIYFGRAVRGFINFGPKVDFLLLENSSDLPSDLQVQHYRVDNKFDYGLCGGFGMSVNTRKAGCYQLEARFAYHLGSLFNNKKNDYFGASNIMALSVNLGWFFRYK